jgi:hypothetical protein
MYCLHYLNFRIIEMCINKLSTLDLPMKLLTGDTADTCTLENYRALDPVRTQHDIARTLSGDNGSILLSINLDNR